MHLLYHACNIPAAHAKCSHGRRIDALSPEYVVVERLRLHRHQGHQSIDVLEVCVVEQAGRLQELVRQALALPLHKIPCVHDLRDIMELHGAGERLDLGQVKLSVVEPLLHLWHQILTTTHRQEICPMGARLEW